MKNSESRERRSFYAQSQKVVPKILDMIDDNQKVHKRKYSTLTEEVQKPRVKWSDDLELIKVFRKRPTAKRVRLLQLRAINTNKSPGKSILRNHEEKVDSQSYQTPQKREITTLDLSDSDSDTEASSICNDCSPVPAVRKSPRRSTVDFGCSPTRAPRTFKTVMSTRAKTRKTYEANLLASRLRMKYALNLKTKTSKFRSPIRTWID